MKNHIIISLLFLSVGFSQQEYNGNDLIEMDNGLWTEKFRDYPISGKVYGYFGEEGNLKKVYIGNIVNGKKEGKWTYWYHDTGYKEYEKNYKDGKEDGLETHWYKNGQMRWKSTYKDGKEDGLETHWYKNGQKKIEKTYKDGEWDRLHTEWYDNGQKKVEANYKDGKEDGVWTSWWKNGQKAFEGTFKDGKKVSSKEWREDGSVSRWPEKERNQFLASCVEAAIERGNSEFFANEYCECSASKLEKKYRNARDIKMEVLLRVQEDCKYHDFLKDFFKKID